MKGVMSMYDYRGKIWGVAISALGLAGMVVERLHSVIIFKKLDAGQHYGVFEWIMLFGLFIIMYSKERYDDDRAKLIRLKALQVAFMIETATILGMAFTATIAKDKMVLEPGELPQIMFMFGGIGIILYLMIFHVGLYFDFLWEYDDKGVWENLKNMGKNKWGILVYFLISAISLVLLGFL